MSRRFTYATVLGLMMAMGLAGVATAGQVNPGDLIVTDFVNQDLVDVNPTTGASFVISQGFTFSNPQGVAIGPNGTIYVSDIGTSTIYAVNPTTGVVTPFSTSANSGPTITRPFEMAFLGNTLYVADGGPADGSTSAVYTVAANGNRTLVAGGSGSFFGIGGVAGLALSSTGSIFASAGSPSVHTVYSVGSGTESPLTTAISNPQGLTFGNGQLFTVSSGSGNPSVWSINPTTGTPTTIADNSGTHGTGPAFQNLFGIVFDNNNGMLYVTDRGTSANPQIDQVNPANGNRTVIAGNSVGGTTFGQLSYGIAVYPTISPTVPEPSGLALLAVGAAGMVVAARRRGSRRAA